MVHGQDPSLKSFATSMAFSAGTYGINYAMQGGGTGSSAEALNPEEGYTLESGGPETNLAGLRKRIPDGVYNTENRGSSDFGMVPFLYNDNVPIGRGIMIHPGNTPMNTIGCIIVGSDYEPRIKSLDGIFGLQPGVGRGNSVSTFNTLLEHYEKYDHKMKVIIKSNWEYLK